MDKPLNQVLKKIPLPFRTKKIEKSPTSNAQPSPPLLKANFCFPKLRQLKYLRHFLSSKEKLTLQILAAVIILSLAFLAIRFYNERLQTAPDSGGEYTEAVIGSPQFVNPVLGVTSDIDKDLTYLIYSGLLKSNANQELVPDLASNYVISEDQKTYTFYLKKEVNWHDEKKFTAKDVVFTIKTIQNPNYKSPLYVSFKGVNLEKIDDFTIKFTLEESFAPFLSILTVGVLPAHLWEPITPEQFSLAVYNTKPIGTGPYKFKSLTKDKTGAVKSYSLESNQEYYNRPPYVKKINFKFYSTLQEAVLALKNKKADGLSYVPKEFKKQLETDQDLNVIPLRLPQYVALFFNQNNNAFLKLKNVRQALTFALNKQRLVNEALDRSGEVIHSPILPGTIGYNPDIRQYEFSLEKAAEVIKNAGFVQTSPEEYKKILQKNHENATTAPDFSASLTGQEYYLQKGSQILEIDLTTVSQSENQKTAEIIKKSWENLGVKVNLKIVSSAEIKEIIKQRNYQALLYGIITGFDPDPYPFWHSSQNKDPGLNLAVFSNREVDHVLEDARKTNDKQIRQDKYIHFQNILVEELPAVFLFNPTYTYALDKKIKNFGVTRIAQPSDRFLNIENWYIKTKKVLKW